MECESCFLPADLRSAPTSGVGAAGRVGLLSDYEPAHHPGERGGGEFRAACPSGYEPALPPDKRGGGEFRAACPSDYEPAHHPGERGGGGRSDNCLRWFRNCAPPRQAGRYGAGLAPAPLLGVVRRFVTRAS